MRIISHAVIIVLILLSIKTQAQYSSLSESPMFTPNKKHVFQDSTGNIVTLNVMDSLYKAGKAKFQIYSSKSRGDSVYWQIRYITELSSIKSRWINKKFPVTAFQDINGLNINVTDLKGKFLVINCWSVTCPPCIKEIPDLNKVIAELGTDNIAYLGISFDSKEAIVNFLKSERLKKFLDIENPKFDFRLIPNQKAYLDTELKVISYPATFIVDNNMIVREVFEGINLDGDKNPKTYTEILDALRKISAF